MAVYELFAGLVFQTDKSFRTVPPVQNNDLVSYFSTFFVGGNRIFGPLQTMKRAGFYDYENSGRERIRELRLRFLPASFSSSVILRYFRRRRCEKFSI